MVPSIQAELPALEAGLARIRVPVGFVHGSDPIRDSPPGDLEAIRAPT